MTAGRAGAASGRYDVVFIGGGASALAGAIAAARAGAAVAVVERDVEAGLTILATGNGRCNISNEDLDSDRYLHPEAARAVFGDSPERDLGKFFLGAGIWTDAESGRLYPVTRRAESVRDALLGQAARLGVRILASTELEGASGSPDGALWSLSLSLPSSPLRARRGHDARGRIRALRRAAAAAPRGRAVASCRALVVACGGASGRVCGMLGIPHLDERPVLCPVACAPLAPFEPGLLDGLSGIRAEAALALLRDGTERWREGGEVLFRAGGLSGIVAFNLSRRARRGDVVRVDLFPGTGAGELARRLEERARALGPSRGASWFDGMLAPAIGAAVFGATGAGGPSADPLGTARLLKGIPFSFEGTMAEESAQVRRGGIPLGAVDLGNMRVVADGSLPPLYACGEALDMDADCGGYNLSWAWLTGIRAGTAAAAISA